MPWRIEELGPGDAIYVGTDRGRLSFTIESTSVYPLATAPVRQIMGFAVARVMTLITRAGEFVPAGRDYTHRRVVRAWPD